MVFKYEVKREWVAASNTKNPPPSSGKLTQLNLINHLFITRIILTFLSLLLTEAIAWFPPRKKMRLI